MIDVAKVTSKGQITLPADVRQRLGIKVGDKVAFIEIDGTMTISNSDSPIATRLSDSDSMILIEDTLPLETPEDTVRRLRVKTAREQLEVIMRAEETARFELEQLASDSDRSAIETELKRLRGERALAALKMAQEAFAGEAERLGLRTEEDVVAMIREVRQQMWDEQHAHHG